MNHSKSTEITRTAGRFVLLVLSGLAVTASSPGAYGKDEPAAVPALKAVKAAESAMVSNKMPDDPTAFFKQYHDALRAADSIEKVMPYLTEARVKQINGDKAKMTAQEFTMMFSFIKEMTPRRTEIVSTEMGKDGDCTINLTAPAEDDPIFGGMVKAGQLKETTRGTVHLVKEGGGWKVEKESWKSSAVSSDADSSKSSEAADKADGTAGGSGNALPAGFGGDCCSGAEPGANSAAAGAAPESGVSVKGGSMTVRPDNEVGKNGSASN